MKKILKFRIWDSATKGFIYTDGLPSLYIDDDRFVIQQCTGAWDENEKDIYEGDYVKSNERHFSYYVVESATKYTHGEVRRHDTTYRICQSYVGGTDMNEFIMCDCCPCGLIVVGNIFENPELSK